MKSYSIGIHSLYKRQTVESKYSHFTGTNEALVAITHQNFPLRQRTYVDDVYAVPIPASSCMSPIVPINQFSFLNSECIAKDTDDLPLICTSVISPKILAKHARVIVYSKEAISLLEDESPVHDYVIVALHCSDDPEFPEHPYEIARNVLDRGVKYSPEQICRAIRYWGTHAFAKARFVRHVDKQIADALRKNQFKKAVARRRALVPEETEAEAEGYARSLIAFMITTDTLCQ